MSTKKDEKKAAKADKNEKNSKFALKLSELRRYQPKESGN